MNVLKNKTVIITGGRGLLGSTFSSACAREGANVVIAEVDGKGREEERCDITNLGDIQSLIEKTLKRFGRIDALVNNAFPRNKHYGRKFEDVTYEDFCENVNMNLGGYFLITQQVAKKMIKQNGGNIVNIASIYAVFAPKFAIYEGTDMTSAVEYAAIKGGVVQLTRYLASYLGKYNIRVNAISPGGIFDDQPKPFVKKYSEHVLLGKRMADPEDITGALLFLLSNASSYVTGQNIVVDGGWHLS